MTDTLLSEKAYRRFKDLLLSNGLRAGQFVSMQDLVGLLDCPLAPTREAIKRVEGESLVRIVPKRGVYVMDVNPELIKNAYGLRALIDQEGARILARSPDKAELADLRKAHRKVIERARKNVTVELQEQAKEVDWRLHESLTASLENRLVSEIYGLNKEKIRVMQNSRPFLPDRIIPAMEEHLRIIDTILAGSAEEAASAVHDHYRNTLRWWGILI